MTTSTAERPVVDDLKMPDPGNVDSLQPKRENFDPSGPVESISLPGREFSRRRVIHTAGVTAVVAAAGTVVTLKWATNGSAPRADASVAVAGGKPNASNTGVPVGAVLTVYQGDMSVTTAGAVIQNLEIRGNVDVRANNVTIKNCLIRGVAVAPTFGSYALIMQYNSSIKNLVVQDCTLIAQSPNPWTSGIQGSGLTIRRCNISNTVDGIDAAGVGNVLVDSCYIHDGSYFTPSNTHSDNQTHDDGIQITNGNNIVFSRNYITSYSTSCFMIGQAQGAVTGMQIINNWLDAGAAQININSLNYPTLKATIRGNRFGRSRSNTYQILAAGSVDLTNITDNIWDDTGTPVKVTIT